MFRAVDLPLRPPKRARLSPPRLPCGILVAVRQALPFRLHIWGGLTLAEAVPADAANAEQATQVGKLQAEFGITEVAVWLCVADSFVCTQLPTVLDYRQVVYLPSAWGTRVARLRPATELPVALRTFLGANASPFIWLASQDALAMDILAGTCRWLVTTHGLNKASTQTY